MGSIEIEDIDTILSTLSNMLASKGNALDRDPDSVEDSELSELFGFVRFSLKIFGEMISGDKKLSDFSAEDKATLLDLINYIKRDLVAESFRPEPIANDTGFDIHVLKRLENALEA